MTTGADGKDARRGAVMKQIGMLDLAGELAEIREPIRAGLDAVLDSRRFVLGPQVEELERRVAAFLRCRRGVAVSSGTDALLCALTAVGIGSGDEVITTPFTFFATAGCICRLGAKPVFVDIEEDTFNIDISQIEAAITPQTRAIVPVHLFGQCADMDEIGVVADRHDLVVIEAIFAGISLVTNQFPLQIDVLIEGAQNEHAQRLGRHLGHPRRGVFTLRTPPCEKQWQHKRGNHQPSSRTIPSNHYDFLCGKKVIHVGQ